MSDADREKIYHLNAVRLINYPAASSGVLEERQLTVFMELMIIIALLFHIVRDRILITMFSYGACEIPVRPEFSSPKLFFTWGHRLNISRAVMLLIVDMIFVTL